MNKFADFFCDKIMEIRVSIEQQHLSNGSYTDDHTTDAVISDLNILSEEEVEQLIRHSATQAFDLDPIPTWVLKQCIDVLLPIINRIIDLSLTSNTMLGNLKEAILAPLIKKILLDPKFFKNFCPILKFIERCLMLQVSEHAIVNNISDIFQSAYKSLHSTDSSFKVQNNILRAVDVGKCVLLVRLDLSTTFDTVTNTILLQCLENYLAITENVLSWFYSYLANHKKSVHLLGASSTPRDLDYGGSILGPFYFSFY